MKLFILLTGMVCATFVGHAQIKKGMPAPPIRLPDLQGNAISLSDLKGKVVLIDFWASWCGPCRANNPRLVKLYKKYHDAGLEIYGVSVDNNSMAWKAAVHQDGLEWLQVNDSKGWEAPSAAAYDVNAIPASFLLDKDGVIRGIDLEGRELESKVKSLLKR